MVHGGLITRSYSRRCLKLYMRICEVAMGNFMVDGMFEPHFACEVLICLGLVGLGGWVNTIAVCLRGR